jgi:uncharacterized surface anchored protein
MALSFTDKSGNTVANPTVDSIVSFNTGLFIPAYVTPKIKSGDYYDIAIPNTVLIKQGVTNVPLTDPSKPAGTPPYAYFSVTPNPLGGGGGTIHIVFTDEAAKSGALTGNMFYQGSLDAQAIGTPGQTTIKFPSEDSLQATVDIKPQTTSGIEKTGVSSRAGTATSISPDTITWTVVINKAMRNVQNIQVKDTFPANLALDGATVKVEKVLVDLYGNVTTPAGAGTDVTGTEASVGPAPTYTVSIAGPTESVYRITYTTPIDTTAITQTGGNYSFTNTASLTSDEYPTPWTATSTVTTNFGKRLEKIATGQSSQTIPGASPAKRLTYTYALRYNYNQGNIAQADAYIDDVYDPDAANGTNAQGGHIGFDASSVVVYAVWFDASGNPQRGDAIDPSLYTVTQSAGAFRVQFANAIAGQAYLVTYQTYATGNAQSSTSTSYSAPNASGVVSTDYTVKNTAQTGGSNPVSSSTTNVVKQQTVTKKFVAADVENKVLTWQVDLNTQRYKVENLVYADTISKIHYIYLGPAGGPPDGANPPVLRDVTASPQKTLVLNQDYTLTTQGVSGGAACVTISLIGDYASTTHALRLTYDTIYDASIVAGGGVASNSGDAAWTTGGVSYKSHSSASYTPVASDQNNGSKSGSYNAVTKTITWDVYLGYAQTPLKNGVFTDQIVSPNAQQQQNYVPFSLHLYHYSIQSDGTTVKGREASPDEYAQFTITDPSSSNNNTITIRFPDISVPQDGDSGNLYMIEYQTSLEGQDVGATYTNTAHFHNDNSVDHDYPASVSVNHGDNIVEKSGTQGKDGYLYWTVVINPSQSTISNVVVHDVPAIYSQSAQTIQTDTVRVVPGVVDIAGNISADAEHPLALGTDYSFTYQTNTTGAPVANSAGKPELVLTLTPGGSATISRPYILTFRTSLMIAATASSSIRPYNNVVIDSDALSTMNSDQTSYVSVSVTKAGGVLQGTLTQFTLTKTALGGASDGTPMSGVTFRLFDSNGNQVGVDQVTDALGRATFGNLVAGTYSLMELRDGVWESLGYAVSDELLNGTYKLTVAADGTVAGGRAQVTNSPGKVVLTKTDAVYQTADVDVNGNGVIDPGEPQIGDPVYVAGVSPDTGLPVVVPKQGPNKLPGATFSLEMWNGSAWGAPPAGFAASWTTDAGGVIEIDGLPNGRYRLTETAAPAGYIRSADPIVFTVGDATGRIAARLDLQSVNFQGVIRFTKRMFVDPAEAVVVGGHVTGDLNGDGVVDQADQDLYDAVNGQPLAGATFDLYDGDPASGVSNVVATGVTDADGRIAFTGLAPLIDGAPVSTYPGDWFSGYWIKETAAPGGFAIPFAGNVYGPMPIPDEVPTGLKLTGSDYTTPIVGSSGAQIELSEIFDIDELEWAAGYKGMPDFIANFAVFLYKEAQVWDDTAGAWVLQGLGGVEFTLTRTAPTPLPGPVTTLSNKNGLVVFSGLDAGTYEIHETSPAPGYFLNTAAASAPFTFAAGGTPSDPLKIVLNPGATANPPDPGVFVNYRASVRFDKTLTDGSPAADALFYLLDGAGDIVSTAQPDGSGGFVMRNIPVATGNGSGGSGSGGSGSGKAYRLVEAQAPAGHILNTEILCEFDITDSGNIAGEPPVIDLSDLVPGASPVPNYEGATRFKKLDADGNPLAGYRFRLERIDTAPGLPPIVIDPPTGPGTYFVSDASGWVTAAGLAPGSYRFLEVKPEDTGNAGYLTNTNPIEFRVPKATAYQAADKYAPSGGAPTALLFTPTPDAHDTSAVDFRNYKGSAELLKQDDYTRAALAGAVYTLYRQNGAKPGDDADESKPATAVGDYTTGADGTFLVENLAPGTYYFKEKTPPAGYQLSAAILPFSVPLIAVEEPPVVKVTAEDTQIPAPPAPPDKPTPVPPAPEPKPTPTPGGGGQTAGAAPTPDTGDAAHPLVLWLLLCASAAGLALLPRRRGFPPL